MTPREQIQEHARVAAKKVKEAMTEFAAATGMTANPYIQWVTTYQIDSTTPTHVAGDCVIAYEDEVRA